VFIANEVQRFRGSEVQRFRGSEVQRFRGSKVDLKPRPTKQCIPAFAGMTGD
jgi:hypothetical protein